MAKRRLSMADKMEFPNKTRQFLDLVGVTNNPQLPENECIKQSLLITQIHLAPHQPRRYFSDEGMESLVVSIREHGILQPLLVRPLESGNYELIAAERRYRAAQTLGMEGMVRLRSPAAQGIALRVACFSVGVCGSFLI